MEQAIEKKLTASTSERVLNGSVLLAGASAAFVVGFFNPSTNSFFPVCPLYAATGIFCPGCGMTRGAHALFNGDVLAAFHFNALWPFYAFLFGYVLLSTFLVVVRGRGLSFEVFKPWVLYGFLTLSLIYMVLRNIPGYPFNMLAPSI